MAAGWLDRIAPEPKPNPNRIKLDFDDDEEKRKQRAARFGAFVAEAGPASHAAPSD